MQNVTPEGHVKVCEEDQESSDDEELSPEQRGMLCEILLQFQ